MCEFLWVVGVWCVVGVVRGWEGEGKGGIGLIPRTAREGPCSRGGNSAAEGNLCSP